MCHWWLYLPRRRADPTKRHVVTVDWKRTDLPRTSVKQDLLFTLGSAMSIFAPSKNNAVERLESLLKHGTDPGQTLRHGAPTPDVTEVSLDHVDESVDEPELTTDIEQVAADQITIRIAEDFAGHALATLIPELLMTGGF